MSDAPEELVRYTIADGVARITLDRPAARNAVTAAMRDRLTALFEQASADLTVRAVLVTGSGDAFCTGADLRGGQPAGPRPDEAPKLAVGDVARLVQQGWQRLVTAVLDCAKPVVAAVNGTTAGAGVHLALACDLVLAAQSARFIEVFVRRGIVPDAAGAYLLTRLIGPQRAKELFFFGDDVPAPLALELGLVNRVVADEELVAVADEWAVRLARGPTQAIAKAKALVNAALDSDRATALRDEAWAQELVQGTADAQEGVHSFVERRTPEFRGW